MNTAAVKTLEIVSTCASVCVAVEVLDGLDGILCRRLGVLLASAAADLIREAEAVVSTGRVAQRTVFG
jgi:hypothetical protein